MRANEVVLFYQKVITKANIGLPNHAELQQVKMTVIAATLALAQSSNVKVYTTSGTFYFGNIGNWIFFFLRFFGVQFPGTGTMVSSIGREQSAACRDVCSQRWWSENGSG